MYHASFRPVTCDHYIIGIVMFAEWKMIAKYITKWDFKYSISCYMLISESLNMQNLLNNRKLQKHQIHCNLLCFDFHKCPIFRPKCTPWLKPSTSLQPFFFLSLWDLTVLHPKTFDSQSFIRPISLSVRKGQRPGFREGLFIGSEQETGCK